MVDDETACVRTVTAADGARPATKPSLLPPPPPVGLIFALSLRVLVRHVDNHTDSCIISLAWAGGLLPRERTGSSIAVAQQVRYHATPAWERPASVVFYGDDGTVPPGTHIIGIFDNADQQGVLGWHTEDNPAPIYGRVFAPLIVDNGGDALQRPLTRDMSSQAGDCSGHAERLQPTTRVSYRGSPCGPAKSLSTRRRPKGSPRIVGAHMRSPGKNETRSSATPVRNCHHHSGCGSAVGPTSFQRVAGNSSRGRTAHCRAEPRSSSATIAQPRRRS